ncbi:MAG: plasmid pRiA4b ORF-3 family protein, partial [Ignavibacteriaceae bacterium]|nr:plasmid pRiA4b ORF-3 family protein [Ignavibacteriaceae bacterium]
IPKVWRDIELAEDQTLEDLHLAIQQAYGWYDDHLYSFYMSGRAWDSSAEIGSPWSDSQVHTHQVQISQLDLKKGKKILYLF